MAWNNAVDATQSGFQSITAAGAWNGRTLTAGAGISITNGNGIAGNPVISAPGAGISWSTTSTNIANMTIDSGYFVIAPGANLTLGLPTTSGVGDTIHVSLYGATSWQITQAAGQQIVLGSTSTTLGAGGSLTSTSQGDSIEIVCVVANTIWVCQNVVGNITVV